MKYVSSARFITMRPPLNCSRLIANAAVVATKSVKAPTVSAISNELPSCRQKRARGEGGLKEEDVKVVQRGVLGPQMARGGGILGRNRKQHHVIDRDQRPQQHRDADQQQSGLGHCGPEGPAFHFESLFIMKYTRGKPRGNATTIDAIDRPTWSSRR